MTTLTPERMAKILACPKCLKTDKLGVWTYENGGRHVECDRCWYLGPCAGSIKAAIKAHNEARAAVTWKDVKTK